MNDNFQNLANAIVLSAVNDYRKVLRTLLQHPYNRSAAYEKRSIERFFHSDYFSVLTSVDPKMLIKRLNQEVIA